LTAVPFNDWHTALNIAAMIHCILDALLPNWQSKIIAFSTDSENTMTGWYSGVVTQINKEPSFNLMRIWCAPHQVDLLVKEASHSMHEGTFYKTLHNFSVHLCEQPNLQLEMGSTCSKDTNQWAHLDHILSWMLHHCHCLLVWITEKNPGSAPDDRWWVMAPAVLSLLELVNVTLVILQSPNLILSQQKTEIENLSVHLMLSMDIELMESNTEFEDLLPLQYVTLEQNWFRIDNVEHHICSQSSWACDLLQGLNDQACILKEVAFLGLKLMNRVMCVQAKHDHNNLATEDIALPVMTHELVNLKPYDFISNVLEKY
jgi:hypothetical protein